MRVVLEEFFESGVIRSHLNAMKLMLDTDGGQAGCSTNVVPLTNFSGV